MYKMALFVQIVQKIKLDVKLLISFYNRAGPIYPGYTKRAVFFFADSAGLPILFYSLYYRVFF